MKRILRMVLSYLLITAMLIGNCSTAVFADSEKTNISSSIIEIGKTYAVPLEFYNLYNESVKGESYVCARAFVDDVAMIQKLNDSEYRVTLHIDNIDKFDILQISKPGAISDDTQPKDVKLGTYNIPDSVICTPESNRDKYPDNAADEAMQNLMAEGYFSEEWNDKYFQKDELTIEKGSLGSGYVSFITKNLESGLYINDFRSYNRLSKSKPYSSCVGRNKIKLLMNNFSEIKELASENYNNAGLEVGRVANTTDINYRSVRDEASINEILELNSIEIENGKAKATIKVKNGVSNVRIINEIYDLGEKSAYPTDIQYKKYTNTYPQERSGTKGLAIYSDELLREDGTFTVEFSGIEEVLFGKKCEITLDGKKYYGELRIRPNEKKAITMTDGDVTLESDSYTVSENAVFASNQVAENTDEESEYNKLYSMLASTASKVKIYKPSLNLNENTVEPIRNVKLKFQIPDGWNADKVRIYRLNGTADDGSMYDIAKKTESWTYAVEDNLCILSTAFIGETYALVEEATAVNLSTLEDGIYKVNTIVWQLMDPTKISMSDASIDNEYTYLVVSDNGTKKQLYFDIQGIRIGTSFGYTSRIYTGDAKREEIIASGNNGSNYAGWKEIEYYSYYTTENGGLDIDGYAVEFNQYYPKRVGLTLSSSADEDNGVCLKFVVPIMDDLSNFVPGSGDGARVAFMQFTGAEKVAEYSEATHNKSVLVVAVDKASKYDADNYTEESYKVLSDAVAKAQEVINGTTSANDSEIVALDKEISDAISGLKEATGLDKYNKVLKSAKALNEADYTAESWADLQAVITAQEGKVTEENAEQASAELQSAVEALVPMSTAVSMEKGVYEVQATLTNQDGTASDLNAGLKFARLYTDKDGNVTVYLYVDGITSMQYRKGAGYENADTDAGRLVVALPANVENHKVKVTTENGETELLLNLDLKSAVKQEIKKSDLESKLNDAKALEEKDYTSDSFAVLTDAVTTAENVLADKVAFQGEIDSAVTGLDTATAGLVMNEEVKARAELEQAVVKVRKNYVEANYTKDSYANLKSALEEAEKVLDNKNATADEMKAQVEKLDKAVKALVRLDDAVDKTELNGYIEDALTKKNDGTYTDNSWNSFQAAIKSAQKVSSDVNATKSEVEKQTKLLTSSYEALVLKNKQSSLFEEYPQIFAGTYSVPIKLLNATSDEDSMGNASMVQTGIVRVSEKGKVTLEMNFQSMKFAGMTGYLYKLKKVDMDSVKYNKYNYPIEYTASDATVLEEYTDVYDLFNDKNSEFYDKNTEGKWYPKKVSIPIDLNDNLFYVEVYVPVMESIGEGQGTKVARVSIDWAKIKQETGVERDNSVIEALIKQVSGMEQGNVPDEYWNALNGAYMTAQDVYNDMNSTQEEINLQIKALQAAVDAVETQIVDMTELNNLIEKATTEVNRTDIVYTSATLEALKTAIANAQAVAGNENATKAEVQAQVIALQTALDGLRVVDKTKLNELIAKAKAEAEKTDVYENSSLTILNTAIELAENVAGNEKATESEVTAAEKALTTALNGLVEKEVVDKSKLESKIAEAKTYLSQTDIYTESSLATLQSAVNRAENVLDNDSASQKLVDEQVAKLTEAIQQLAKKNDGKLDINNLSDGVYSIYGTMVKVDKNTYSMSNEAINHTIKLTVKNGKYYITLNFNGLTVGQKLGYLSQLKYFTTGYTLDKYGNPQGTLADVTVDSYQKNSDGTLVSDIYGTNYPDEVTFELIPEALNDGYVPLQVFVPIMDAISSGTGTQPVFLKLDWSSLKATTSDDPNFDNNDNNNNNNNNNGNNNNSNGNNNNSSSLGNNTLGSGSSSLGNSSLSSGSSSLKSSGTGSSLSSGTSSLKSGSTASGGSSLKSATNAKTEDTVQSGTLWSALLLLGGVVFMAVLMDGRKKRATK